MTEARSPLLVSSWRAHQTTQHQLAGRQAGRYAQCSSHSQPPLPFPASSPAYILPHSHSWSWRKDRGMASCIANSVSGIASNDGWRGCSSQGGTPCGTSSGITGLDSGLADDQYFSGWEKKTHHDYGRAASLANSVRCWTGERWYDEGCERGEGESGKTHGCCCVEGLQVL